MKTSPISRRWFSLDHVVDLAHGSINEMRGYDVRQDDISAHGEGLQLIDARRGYVTHPKSQSYGREMWRMCMIRIVSPATL
jgi:hypothetical protein